LGRTNYGVDLLTYQGDRGVRLEHRTGALPKEGGEERCVEDEGACGKQGGEGGGNHGRVLAALENEIEWPERSSTSKSEQITIRGRGRQKTEANVNNPGEKSLIDSGQKVKTPTITADSKGNKTAATRRLYNQEEKWDDHLRKLNFAMILSK